MSLMNYAKPVIAGFWLLAALNVLMPFAEPWAARLNWLAVIIVVAHVIELLLFKRRLQAQLQPWLARAQVLLFGFFHLRSFL